MKNNKVTEKELDNLLNYAFLGLDFNQPNDSKLLQAVADYSLNSKAITAVKSVKSILTKLILLLVSLGILVSVIYYFNRNNKMPDNKLATVVALNNFSKDSVKIVAQEILLESEKTINKPFIDKELNQSKIPTPVELVEKRDTITAVVVYQEVVKINENKTENIVYSFPKLTEKEIKENIKEKKKIAKLATKLSKERYALITGKGFYMQTTEVTNLEYRTFLFDLLIQGKNDEFLKAKPEQQLWLNAGGLNKFDSYKDLYFSDSRFNYFPVVNLSQEGAELYCKWLSELVASNLNTKNKKPPVFTFKLPDENEWIYAAKVGKANATYPWGRDSIQNAKNRFLANFCVQKLKDKFNQPIIYPTKTNPNAYTSASFALNLDTIATVHVFSYNPNDYFLYCMSGNVSEMVYIVGSKNIKTKGGNWTSDFEHLKINSEDEFKTPIKPSPMIGFRILVSIEN